MSEFCICQHPRPAGDTLKCLTCDLQVLQTPVLPATIAELCRQVLQLCKDAGCHTVELAERVSRPGSSAVGQRPSRRAGQLHDTD